MHKISSKYALNAANREVNIGVYIYDNELAFSEKYDDYELLYTNVIEGQDVNVFVKKNETDDKDYSICFYIDNKEYFVEGKTDVDFLEAVSKEYLEYITNKK